MSVGPDADGFVRRPFLESRRTRRGDGVEALRPLAWCDAVDARSHAGHGYQMCIAFQLTERTVQDLSSMKQGGSCEREASLKLLKRWCSIARRSPSRNARSLGGLKS